MMVQGALSNHMHAGGREATSGDEVRARGAQDTGIDIPPGIALVPRALHSATGAGPGAATGQGNASQAENASQAQQLMSIGGTFADGAVPRSFDDVFSYFERSAVR